MGVYMTEEPGKYVEFCYLAVIWTGGKYCGSVHATFISSKLLGYSKSSIYIRNKIILLGICCTYSNQKMTLNWNENYILITSVCIDEFSPVFCM